MNFLARNEDRHFYLLGVWRDEGGAFIVSSVFLLPDGTKRADGGSYSFAIKEMAVEKCRRILSLKRKKRGYEQVRLTELPEPGKVFLKPSLGDYVTPEEMLRMVTEASRERYVEFEFADGLEDRFDEGVEYLAMKDLEEDGFYDVWDRNGEQYHCHDSRFSRMEPTERAREVGVVGV